MIMHEAAGHKSDASFNFRVAELLAEEVEFGSLLGCSHLTIVIQ